VDREAMDRFTHHEAQQSSPQPQNESDPLDSRSSLKKLVEIIHPSQPIVSSVQKPTQLLTSFCLIGRDKTVCEATEAIQNNQSILLTGPAGVGKSHVLKALADTIPGSILIKSPVPFKPMLLEIAQALCPDESFNQRTPNAEILDAIFSADTLVAPVILIDNLDRLKVSEEEIMMNLTDKFPVVAVAGEKPNRLKSLWWKFQELPVEPLDLETTKQLISHLLQKHSMNPDEYTMLETKVLNLANGNPFAVVELISQLPQSKKVTADHIREIHHEAGIVYRDWTWIFMVLWGLLVISRFVALGTHSFEGYILAGIGTTVFLTFKTLARMKR
jgi:energy-coupling factor transporter ATP-binding protein EcfA2